MMSPAAEPSDPSPRSDPARGASRPDCELCRVDGGKVVWRDASLRVVQVDDADYPGFCRVIWHAHHAEFSELTSAERAHLLAAVAAVEHVLRECMQCDKINVASLGNMVAHQHWHVIPRFADDPHFPQAIWAARQRDVAPAVLAARVAAAAALPAKLTAALDCALDGALGDA